MDKASLEEQYRILAASRRDHRANLLRRQHSNIPAINDAQTPEHFRSNVRGFHLGCHT